MDKWDDIEKRQEQMSDAFNGMVKQEERVRRLEEEMKILEVKLIEAQEDLKFYEDWLEELHAKNSKERREANEKTK